MGPRRQVLGAAEIDRTADKTDTFVDLAHVGIEVRLLREHLGAARPGTCDILAPFQTLLGVQLFDVFLKLLPAIAGQPAEHAVSVDLFHVGLQEPGRGEASALRVALLVQMPDAFVTPESQLAVFPLLVTLQGGGGVEASTTRRTGLGIFPGALKCGDMEMFGTDMPL